MSLHSDTVLLLIQLCNQFSLVRTLNGTIADTVVLLRPLRPRVTPSAARKAKPEDSARISLHGDTDLLLS